MNASAGSLDNISPLTACAWVNTRSLNQSFPNVFNKGGGWDMYFDGDPSWGFFSSRQGYKETANISADVWMHLCATWDGSDGHAGITLYRDGAEASVQTSGDSGVDVDDQAFNLTIGGSEGDANAEIQGKVDDVRIYNRTLSPAEIQQLYKLGTVIIRP